MNKQVILNNLRLTQEVVRLNYVLSEAFNKEYDSDFSVFTKMITCTTDNILIELGLPLTKNVTDDFMMYMSLFENVNKFISRSEEYLFEKVLKFRDKYIQETNKVLPIKK